MKPTLLLVEDDPISGRFLAAALEALPATVEVTRSVADAIAAAGPHDLWLLDANLPDGSGIGLLARLRERHPRVPALAHTADDSPSLKSRLLASGFAAVLVKPLAAVALQRAVRQALGLELDSAPEPGAGCDSPDETPLWDDAVALAALNGNATHLQTLRDLFLQELERQHSIVFAALASRDFEQARHQLHQMRASSGFVGAMRLQRVATLLEKSPEEAYLAAEFDAVLRQTRSRR
jgi:CheY-like chemotaxis protein/HPt (histidine-containing phosphotransfer) domain-containing protein